MYRSVTMIQGYMNGTGVLQRYTGTAVVLVYKSTGLVQWYRNIAMVQEQYRGSEVQYY